MKKLFFILIVISHIAFPQGILEGLGILQGLNIFPNKSITTKPYYKNLFGTLYKDKTQQSDLLGIGLGYPLATNTYLEFEFYTNGDSSLDNKIIDDSQITYGYSITAVGHYPITSGMSVFLRYGWTELENEENNESTVSQSKNDSFEFGYGITLQLLKSIAVSYEKRDFPTTEGSNEKIKGRIYSIHITL